MALGKVCFGVNLIFRKGKDMYWDAVLFCLEKVNYHTYMFETKLSLRKRKRKREEERGSERENVFSGLTVSPDCLDNCFLTGSVLENEHCSLVLFPVVVRVSGSGIFAQVDD